MGQNGAVLGEIPHFGPFPKEKQQKGCQNGWKTRFHQIWFSALQMTPYYVRSTCVVFSRFKKALVRVLALTVKSQCQNLN